MALLLALICAGVVCYKFHLLKALPFFDPKDGYAFYWTESAFHFRHFLMIAEGKEIPSLDYGIQYPEGLDTVRYTTPLMERVAGKLYRLLFSTIPPHLFLVHFSFLFSTFSVLAMFLAGRIAWGSKAAAFICALSYGFTPASLMRTAGGGFIREDFALPFIFFSLGCFLYCLRKDSPLVSAVGSLLMVIALAAWHVTQLYLSLFMVGMTTVYFIRKGERLPRKSLFVFVLFMVIAAIALPPLRAKYFLFSPALMLGYALLVSHWIPVGKGPYIRKHLLIHGLAFVSLFLLALIIQKSTGSYSHVYELILNKIRFLGVLPEDPARLSFEAKSMWTSAFVSPRWAELPLLFLSSLLFGTLGVAILAYRAIKTKAKGYEILIFYFTVCTFVLFLMIHRMGIFAVFFLVLSMGALSLFRQQYLRYAAYGGLIVCCLLQFSILLGGFKLKAFRPNQVDLKNLLSFIRTETDRDLPVLTTFQLGPAVAVYAGHPVVLHSKFESKFLRDKVKRVYTSLYRSEGEFYELCQAYKAGLFVYQTDMALYGSPGSIRYQVGAIPFKTDSAAFLSHFEPDSLRHFRLIYQNHTYRVFRVGAQPAHAQRHLTYEPIYDLEVFLDRKDPGQSIEDKILQSGLVKLRRAETHRTIGDRFLGLGDHQSAILAYRRALSINPQEKGAVWGIGKAFVEAGDKAKAKEVFIAALRMDPNYDISVLDLQNAEVWLAMGDDELNRTRYLRAESLFRRALSVEPDLADAYFGLGQALFGQERLEEAKSAFQSGIYYDPKNYRAYETIGKIYASQGDMENAAVYVQKSLSINPTQPHLKKILRLLRKEVGKKRKNP